VIRICVAGVTGWVGRSLVPAIVSAPDLTLVGAVGRSAAGHPLAELLTGAVLPAPAAGLVVSRTIDEALGTRPDVVIDYTSPAIAKQHVLAAITQRVHVVIGTSGLTDADYEEIDAAASRAGVGVLAAGNFAITAVLLEHFALTAAKYLPSWEVIDYAHAAKIDAPSGTARQLAFRLSRVGTPEIEVPIERTSGSPEARGLTLRGVQVHSVRLPGYVISIEVLFGNTSERLSIRHDAGSGAEPYVGGTLLAVRAVGAHVGLVRGLDALLGLGH
jgi:4-hydroxy-tetrahydrodipicolinate reductase